MNIPSWIRRIAGDRRKEKRDVDNDRRGGGGKGRAKEVHERLERALDDFEQTVSVRRDEIRFSANDIQQEVQFPTFREICRFKVNGGQYRLCRNPSHEAANTGIAICDEQLCPFMLVQKVPA